jgi:glucan phosphoethanolaminetransferase (alkaline phosphatase superfamily)
MDLSKFLAKALGIYLIIISLAMLTNMPQFVNYVQNMLHDPTLMFVTGFIALVIGILLVVSHNIWQWHWRVIITIIGWISLIKGASIILYPHFIDKLSMLFVQNTTFAYSAAVVDLVLGLILLYFGFVGHFKRAK